METTASHLVENKPIIGLPELSQRPRVSLPQDDPSSADHLPPFEIIPDICQDSATAQDSVPKYGDRSYVHPMIAGQDHSRLYT